MAKILVAVADRDERERYAFALRFAGHDVSGSGEFREAVSIALLTQPNLLLLDTRLLDQSEDQDAQFLAREIQNLHLPVMYLYDEATPLESFSGSTTGTEMFLRKPIALNAFAKSVNQFLKRSPKRNR